MEPQGFLSLSEEKQKEILSAALEEFSQHGYDLASTNNIVAKAGISKGLLFKYFLSKENLFLFIVDKFGNDPSGSSKNKAEFKDIFEYLEHSLKTDIYNVINNKDTRLFLHLLNRMYLDPNHKVYTKALANFISTVNAVIDDYCCNLDASLLRDGLSVDDLKKMLYFLTDSMRIVFHKNPNRLSEESEEVLRDARMVWSVTRMGFFKD